MIGLHVKFNPFYLDSIGRAPVSSYSLRGTVIAINEYKLPYRDNEFYLTVNWGDCEIAYRIDRLTFIPEGN